MDRFHLESIAPLVRLRDAEKLIALVNEASRAKPSPAPEPLERL